MTSKQQIPAMVCGEIGLVRSLGEAGIPVYVGSYYADNIAYYSKYCARKLQFEHSTSRDFVDRLVAFGKQEGRKMVFFSDDDRAVLTFSQYRSELEPFYYHNLPDHDLVDTILDKRRFAAKAESLGLPVPRSFMPSSEADVESAAQKLEFPCILKPSHKDDWWDPRFLQEVGPYRKAMLCQSREELLEYYRKVSRINPAVVVQEYVDGDDRELFSVNMYLDSSSRELAHFIGHKIRVYPIHAGVGCLVETVRDDEISAAARDAAHKLGLRGHVNIQFKRDRGSHQLKIMELHTRNSLWAYLATGSGLNITAIAYYDMIGQPCPFPNSVRYGVKWIDLNKDVKAFLDYRSTGEWTFPRWWKSFAGRRVFHVHSLTDPRPLLMDSWYLLKRSLAHSNVRGAAPHA
jgi:D-aspartate ligase